MGLIRIYRVLFPCWIRIRLHLQILSLCILISRRPFCLFPTADTLCEETVRVTMSRMTWHAAEHWRAKQHKDFLLLIMGLVKRVERGSKRGQLDEETCQLHAGNKYTRTDAKMFPSHSSSGDSPPVWNSASHHGVTFSQYARH